MKAYYQKPAGGVEHGNGKTVFIILMILLCYY